jgi:hypothetical protein
MKEPGRGEAPRTIGELRRLLAEMGDPWQPDPSLSDEEPIPQFATGGDETEEPAGEVLGPDELIDFLRREPPSNPFLREVWRREGLLDDTDNGDAETRDPS